jgi:tetratricopeptide (TPR) repeat protein
VILLLAAALAAAAPAAACPDSATPQAFVCHALQASKDGKPDEAAASFEKAALAAPADDPARSRMWAAAGNMWIAAAQPGKAALALDRALAGSGLRAEQRGEALLDRARAAEAQNDLKTARAKLNEAAASISEDPFYWYFSAALAIREMDKATAQSSINRALAIAPGDPTVLFEAGHVAHFLGDQAKAREYWSQAAAADPASASGKAAREALALLDQPAPVQSKAASTK